eukprot:4189750-Prymnesium_polylepis.2
MALLSQVVAASRRVFASPERCAHHARVPCSHTSHGHPRERTCLQCCGDTMRWWWSGVCAAVRWALGTTKILRGPECRTYRFAGTVMPRPTARHNPCGKS